MRVDHTLPTARLRLLLFPNLVLAKCWQMKQKTMKNKKNPLKIGQQKRRSKNLQFRQRSGEKW